MDVFPVLDEHELEDGAWQKIQEYVQSKKEKLVRKLIAKESEEVRGRIKQLEEFLNDVAGITPTTE